MIKLLSIICLVLAIVLFPPAALALVSNNAVPGDATYPIKSGEKNQIKMRKRKNQKKKIRTSKSLENQGKANQI